MRIRVRDVCPASRITRSDGEKLRAEILRLWSADELLEVDFEHETIASVSFLDEAIAVLFAEHGAEVVRSRLRPLHLTDGDRRLLNQQVAFHRRKHVAMSSRDPLEP